MANKTKDFYKEAKKNIEQKLALLEVDILSANPFPERSQLWQYKHYRELLTTIDSSLNIASTKQVGMMDEYLEELYEVVLEEKLDYFGRSNYSVISKDQIQQVISEEWNGSNYSKRMWGNNEKLAQRIKNDITNLIATGQNPATIRQGLMNDFKVGYSVADRLVRTEANHTYNKAAANSYKAAGINQVEILDAADERTCDECAELAHTKYDLGTEPQLPIHPNCRCCYVPVID